MDYGWQTIGDDVIEEWRYIYETGYQISNKGRIRKLYKYKGKVYCPHFCYIKSDGFNVCLQKKKYNIPELMCDIWEYKFIDDLDGEFWIDIHGYEELYQVSNFGRIRSKRKRVKCKNGKTFYQHERIIKPTYINSGYEIVNLHGENGRLYHRLVHRLVAEHFLPNPLGLEQVNHKDEDKTNNHVDNLEWCTRVYNSLYGTCQERRIQTRLKNNEGKYGVCRKSKRNSCIEK